MVRHKLYTTIHVIGLAVGICACLAIWAITHYELSFDRFHPNRDRIYRIGAEMGERKSEMSPNDCLPEPATPALRNDLTGIETIAQFHNVNMSVTIPGDHRGKISDGGDRRGHAGGAGQDITTPREPDGRSDYIVFAEPEYFDIFKYTWLAGDPARSLKEPFQVVLTASEAQKYFGAGKRESGSGGGRSDGGRTDWSEVLGRTIYYDDSLHVTVSGIVKDLDGVTDFTFTNFISYATARATPWLSNDLHLDCWGCLNNSSQTFVLLDKGVSPARVNQQLTAFSARYRDQMFGKDYNYQMELEPLSQIHFDPVEKDYGSQADLPTLYKLMGIAIFILILASINFINLTTAQSLQRAKEIGIRKVLGSRRIALVFQFMSETVLVVVFSLVLSLVLLRPVLSAFPDYVPAGVTVNLLDPATIGFALGVLLAAALLSGLYPALVLSSFQPVRTLKSGGGSPRSLKNRLGKGLVVFQFTISAIFIISSIVVGNQMRFMLNKDMGFSKDAVIRFVSQSKDDINKRKLLAARIRTLPDVDKVSLDNSWPMRGGYSKVSIKYAPAGATMAVNIRTTDTNYLGLYGIRLVAGRNFFASDTGKEALINANYAQALGFRHPADALGISLPLTGTAVTVVGVVADFNLQSLAHAIEPAIILPLAPSETGFSVKLHTRGKTVVDFQHTIAAIEGAWKETFHDEPFRYTWFDAAIEKVYKNEERMAGLIHLAMLITIVVSCMGLFGLAALTAEQRTKEIGIRKVLGAGVGDITGMLSRDFVFLVGIALVIAAPVAWYFMHEWLQGYAYKVTIGWGVFVLAGVGAVGIALITVGWHAVRAAMMSPVKSLRSE
jgi:ABC-type antimicrobial peptide transport system permease subunit